MPDRAATGRRGCKVQGSSPDLGPRRHQGRQSVWVEVKAKAEPTLQRKTNRLEHGICRRLYQAYRRVEEITGAAVGQRGRLGGGDPPPRHGGDHDPPDMLAQIVKDAILERLDVDAHDRVLAAEEAAKAELSEMLAGIGR
jgi:hypothetical protein